MFPITAADESGEVPDLDLVLGALDHLDMSALLALREALSDTLVDKSFVELDDKQVVDAAQRLQRQTRRDEAVQVALTTQMLERGLPAKRGLRRHGFLREVLGLNGSEAAARVGNTEHCAPLVGLTGDTLPPYAPTMATLLREGSIGTAHVRVMRSVIAKFPSAVRDDRPMWEAAEQQLGELAAMLDPDQLTKAVQRLLAYLDPDGVDDDDRDRKRRRGLTLGRQGVDHVSGIRGELDPVTRALWDVLAEKWARPGMNNPDDPESPVGDADKVHADVLAAAAKRDTRTAAQRNHDAFTLMLRTITESGVLGQHRGLPAQVIVTMTLDELEAETGIATTASGGHPPVRDALALAGTSRPLLALLDDKDRPLFFGRQRRLASADQRMALIASQRGCTRPGCDNPDTRVAVHHVQVTANMGGSPRSSPPTPDHPTSSAGSAGNNAAPINHYKPTRFCGRTAPSLPAPPPTANNSPSRPVRRAPRNNSATPCGTNSRSHAPTSPKATAGSTTSTSYPSATHPTSRSRREGAHRPVTLSRMPTTAADLTADALEFLTERHLASVVTLRHDGTPHSVAVGFTYDQERRVVRVITSDGKQKVRNVDRSGYAAVTQVDGPRWLTLEGPARILRDADDVQIAERRYAQRYREPRPNPRRVVVEIDVARVLGSRSLLDRT
ncbi:TIGR03618 family F420-dependent PPOX class oxidoreductase [Williamsia sterculiae]|uniref:PPOX class probable F420-dependent enzyme n=1 Tax=Williamsia sterculiae TaxID=1344003 RepID=A0A1N7EN29_9NOCA|nr:TIGR03618 family F420-dependent PPOX class oxidoreductase [Williamsia sterculiae]SIR89470.1 PPOX class probable F420-dependent enzyme [Williamsia sterculiae]